MSDSLKIIDCLKAGWSNITEEQAEYVLWSRTPFPIKSLTAKEYYIAANRTRRAWKNGIRLCDFCDCIAEANDGLCKECRKSFDECKGEHEKEKSF
jgi:hypothetical protein